MSGTQNNQELKINGGEGTGNYELRIMNYEWAIGNGGTVTLCWFVLSPFGRWL